MKVKIYSIFDSKTAAFGRPFFNISDGSAIRIFSDLANDQNAMDGSLYKHPEDYSLFAIGEFEDELGEIKGFTPKNLVTASAVRNLSLNGTKEEIIN